MGRPSLGWWPRMVAGSSVVLVPAGAGRATCESCCVECCKTIVVWAAGSRASAQLQCVLPRRLELGAEGAPKGKGSAEGRATKDRGLPEQDPHREGCQGLGQPGRSTPLLPCSGQTAVSMCSEVQRPKKRPKRTEVPKSPFWARRGPQWSEARMHLPFYGQRPVNGRCYP